MILGIIIGVSVTLFVLLIIGMYLEIIKQIRSIQTGVAYLVQREYELQQDEEKTLQELEQVKKNLNTVYNN